MRTGRGGGRRIRRLSAAAFAAGSVAAAAIAITLWAHGASAASDAPAEMTSVPGQMSGIKLVAPIPNGEWRLPAGDYGNVRYSPLDQINTQNVANLKVFSEFTTGIPHGHEGQPLIVNNMMYVVTPYPNNLIAVDLTKPDGGAVKWIYQPNPPNRSVGIACCDVVNRGASFGNGKIVYNLLDGETVAVDAQSGKPAWRVTVGNMDRGETITMAPLVVKGEVIVGSSGGELGVLGSVTALDLNTGKQLWRAYSAGADKDCLIGPDFHPFYKKDQGKDLGIKTWSSDHWKLGGGNVWGWISYDPETNEIFYGTGNPGVWNPDQRPGANKWSVTIFARDADTGYAKWAFQTAAHDDTDYDEIMENILIDMPWQGKTRKLLIHPGRTGFIYVMDRQTGELLAAQKFMPSTNWAFGYDLKTGEAQRDPSKDTHEGVWATGICPSSTGAKEVIPSSLSPRTGLLYIPAHNVCMDYEGINASYIEGVPYLGAAVKMYRGPASSGDPGQLIAWDVQKGKPAWVDQEGQFPVYSGVLSTGGDVVFFGTMDGWFKAVDARSGKELWKHKLASGIVGNPIAFKGPDGKQYVALYAGIGGWMGAVDFPSVSESDTEAALGVTGAMTGIKTATSPGGVVYVFAL